MPGERSYSTAAVTALCDTYYGTTPRPRVEDIKQAAAAGQLRTGPGPRVHRVEDNVLPTETTRIEPAVQAELAQISRARMFELLRQDPRHNDQERREATLNTMRERLDTINTQGINGWSRAREADKLLEALDNARNREEASKPRTLTPEQLERLKPLSVEPLSTEVTGLLAQLTNGESSDPSDQSS